MKKEIGGIKDEITYFKSTGSNEERLMIYIALLLGFFFFTGPAPPNAHAEKIVVNIGTGGVAGLYYHTGQAIAKTVNKKDGLQVKVEFTGASVFNVNAMMVGDLEFGIVQSDRQYQAWNGIKDWKDRGPQKSCAVSAVFIQKVSYLWQVMIRGLTPY